MVDRETVGFCTGFLVPNNMSSLGQNGSEITGKVSSQSIRLRNACLHNAVWLSGRALRTIAQCTGIGALILYFVELRIARSDLSKSGASVTYALVAIAHWVPIAHSRDSKQQTAAQERLNAVYRAFPSISARINAAGNEVGPPPVKNRRKQRNWN
jgi:hypothetical protein